MQVIQEVLIERITIPQERLTSTLSEEEFASLCESIRTAGLICPILLTPEGPNFLLVSGLNRLRAAQQIGWTHISAIIRHTDPTRASILNITENLARGKTNPIDEAIAIRQLALSTFQDPEELSPAINRSTAWINSRIELLNLPDGLQEVIQNGQLSVAAAKELSAIEDPHILEYLVNQAIESGASAKTIRHWIGKLEGATAGTKGMTPSTMPPFPPSETPIPLIDCFACGEGRQPHDLRPELLCENCSSALSAYTAKLAPGDGPG